MATSPTNPSWGEYAVAFQSFWSAIDVDVFCTRYDAAMNQITLHVIDTSTVAWEEPAIAANNIADRFLVVAQVSTARASPYWIAGRTVTASSGVVGNIADIESPGPHDKLRPDVGGDMEFGAPTYFAVVWEGVITSTNSDIFMKLVDRDGLPIQSSFQSLESSTVNARFPSISKTNGVGDPQTRGWGVAWNSTFAQNDEDIRGAIVRWNGVIVRTDFSVNTSRFSTTYFPSVSSPTDERNGQRTYLFAYENNNQNGSLQIFGTLIDQAGTSRGVYDLTANLDPTYPHFAPSVDCDGGRFVLGYHDWHRGQPADIDAKLATFALGAQGPVLQDQAVLGGSTDDEYSVEVTSTHSPGGNHVRFGCTWLKVLNSMVGLGNTSVHARLYDGMAAGGGLSTRVTHCGTGAGFQVVGQPAIGAWIQLTMDLPTAPRGFFFGTPTTIPIPMCPGCTLGVQGSPIAQDPLRITIPCAPYLVGLTVSLQPYKLGGGPCLGGVALGDTLDVTIR